MMTRIIIDNVKEEYIPAFRGLADGTNATFTAESSDDTICDYGYSHEPNDETIKALQECENGNGGRIIKNHTDFHKEMLAKIANGN